MKLGLDSINIILMIASCALAYVLPFELVLLSYAFLGPAHYLTQISWMHDRQYFTGHHWLWIPGSIITMLLIWIVFAKNADTNYVYALYALAIIASAIALLKNRMHIVATALLCAIIMAALWFLSAEFAKGLTILLPTVVHIYVFTGCFILFGALKSGSKMGFLSFAIYLACAGMFFLITPHYIMYMPQFVSGGNEMFQGVADYLAQILSFGGWIDEHAMLGFLSFAYTYHYLNWFSKAEIIKWHKIPKLRLAIIVTIYLAAIGLYLINYQLGFLALLFLSLLHVILEFPLNIYTFRELGRLGLMRFKPHSQPVP